MAPKAPEKQHTQQQQHQHHQQQPPVHNNIKHSNPFHISAHTLCNNKSLKLKRLKYGKYLQNILRNNHSTPKQKTNSQKTEMRRQKLSLLQPDVTIDLLSDNDEELSNTKANISFKDSVILYPGRMCLERAAILGLMPIERSANPPPLVPLATNNRQIPEIVTKQSTELMQAVLTIPMTKHLQPLPPAPQKQQPRKRKSKPQKRRPAAFKIPTLLNHELIVLSDDSNDMPEQLPPLPVAATTIPTSSIGIMQSPDLSVTCSTSSQIPCLPQQNTMQVDEEVTVSLVPRTLNTSNCTNRSLNSSNCTIFPMLPDETTVHTVIANRTYELTLTKLREGLATCGIPEFADGKQKISPQRRKGMLQQPPVVSPPRAPISLKLSSDLSISLISDDDEDEARHYDPILSPAFLQKLPVNVSIAPVPMPPPNSNHANDHRKLKLG